MNPSFETRAVIEQGLRDYTRKKAKYSMRTNSIQLKNLGISLHLDIPDFGITEIRTVLDKDGQLSENDTGILDVLSSHLRYRHSTPPSHSADELSILRQCISEVRTIALLFPDIRDTNIRTCMAAILGTLCSADDIIEDMMPDEATAVLHHSIQTLREESYSCSSQHAVVQYFIVFKQHCSTQLSKEVARRFFGSVCIILEALLDEIKFSQGDLPYNLETYMSIRRRTIGMPSFFTLARSILETKDHQWSPEILDMESDACAILGLQNDLVGLEKDIRAKEKMNAVFVNVAQIAGQTIYAGDDATLQAATNNICALHNHLMGRVLERHANIQQRAIGTPRNALECRVADMQLMATETHLKWCTMAKRYNLIPELHMI